MTRQIALAYSRDRSNLSRSFETKINSHMRRRNGEHVLSTLVFGRHNKNIIINNK